MKQQEMQETRAQVEPARAAAMDATRGSQVRESFEWIQRLDEQLTRTDFLTNGGAAIATLAFLGTQRGSPAMTIALGLFAAGVIATGFELRALSAWFAALHKDALRRRRGWVDDTRRVADLGVASDIGKQTKAINQWAGWFAQLAFVAGAISAGLAFL